MGMPLVISDLIVGNGCQCCRYEGTGRSLSLKLIEQLRQQSAVGGASGKNSLMYVHVYVRFARNSH